MTAAREAREEAGVVGEIAHEPLTIFPLMKKEEMMVVEAYLLRVGKENLAREKKRGPRWLTPKEAQEQLSQNRTDHDVEELRRVVRLACMAIKSAPSTGHFVKPLTLPTQPIRVFVSYSHQDKKYLEKNSLLGFIQTTLEAEGFEFWSDKRIATGEMWDDVIRNEIKRTDICRCRIDT